MQCRNIGPEKNVKEVIAFSKDPFLLITQKVY